MTVFIIYVFVSLSKGQKMNIQFLLSLVVVFVASTTARSLQTGKCILSQLHNYFTPSLMVFIDE